MDEGMNGLMDRLIDGPIVGCMKEPRTKKKYYRMPQTASKYANDTSAFSGGVFLDASSIRGLSLRWSVHPSIGWSIRRSVRHAFIKNDEN